MENLNCWWWSWSSETGAGSTFFQRPGVGVFEQVVHCCAVEVPVMTMAEEGETELGSRELKGDGNGQT